MLATLDESGSVETADFADTEVMGCHKGNFAGLNIANPQPDTHYIWATNNRREILHYQMEGFEVVQADDQETAAIDLIGGDWHRPAQLDSGFQESFPGVVLMKQSGDKLRERREKQQAANEAMLRGTADGYLGRESGAEQQIAANDGGMGGSLRLQGREHRYEEYDKGQVVSQWTPGNGIIKK